MGPGHYSRRIESTASTEIRDDEAPPGSPRVLAAFRSDETVVVTRRQQIFGGAVLNVLVNVVVLNLYVEFAEKVVIDSFWISVLTAVLLTVMIGLLSRIERRVHHFFFAERGWKVAGVLATWLLLFGSKFVILEVVDIVFGEHVELGKLVEVILIVLTMMVAAQLMHAAYDALGPRDRSAERGTADPAHE